MQPKRHDRRTGCPVEATLSVVGGIWKPLILFALLDGSWRFGELGRQVPRATPRMLTLQLRELEADGIVSRTVHAQVPPRVDYALTSLGRSLEPVLTALHLWGETHRAELLVFGQAQTREMLKAAAQGAHQS